MKLRRIIPRVIVLVIAGAIVNVAVAWGLALVVEDVTMSTHGGFVAEDSSWFVVKRDGVGVTLFWVSFRNGGVGQKRALGENPSEIIPSYGDMAEPSLEFWALPKRFRLEHREILACGLPMRCCWCKLPTYIAKEGWATWLPENGAIKTVLPWFVQRHARPRVLPHTVIWPGFAINTIFYAAVLWAVFLGPGKVRRRLLIRRLSRRGLCPACAYDLRGSTSPVCTECGAAVRRLNKQ